MPNRIRRAQRGLGELAQYAYQAVNAGRDSAPATTSYYSGYDLIPIEAPPPPPEPVSTTPMLDVLRRHVDMLQSQPNYNPTMPIDVAQDVYEQMLAELPLGDRWSANWPELQGRHAPDPRVAPPTVQAGWWREPSETLRTDPATHAAYVEFMQQQEAQRREYSRRFREEFANALFNTASGPVPLPPPPARVEAERDDWWEPTPRRRPVHKGATVHEGLFSLEVRVTEITRGT